MIQRVVWGAIVTAVLLVAGLTIAVVAYVNDDAPLAMLGLTITIGSATASLLALREA